ncbi:uncharacterized protein FIBRA_05210 [Fibroporia radiculosa]|uniref:Rad51-like C-terminal domain-containing protein n=1 Tax=Fibroporia radiculosa TaxID=599839 RepID=J4GQK7_9APHY|nr:uncharacterized protein FIBRA_05210 [Fibroporia radiculosa]CCM03090.1 predicted protein [Fibroporia radiculosa]
MRLRALVPPLPENLLDALDACDITTDSDLIFVKNLTELFRKLPPMTMGFQEFLDLVSRVIKQAAAPAIRGDQLLAKERKRREDDIYGDLSTGVPELDVLLGGLRPPRVVEISGDKGSGKTALALQIVLRNLSTVFDSAALWIDTDGAFAPERIPSLLESYPGEVPLKHAVTIINYSDDEQGVGTVLDRLQIALAFDVETTQEVLEQLRFSLSSDPPVPPIVRCVVIDSITPLLGPLLSAISSQGIPSDFSALHATSKFPRFTGHAIMTTFMRQLRALADTFSLTILVINSSSRSLPCNPDSAFLSTVRKPALGPSFTFLTDTTLWLSKDLADSSNADEEATTHVAEIFRSKKTVSHE